jgi:light-regulated signal transduction histidine kinase (bacteriophytochrome)
MVASYTQLLSERYAGKLDERADRYIGYAVDGAKRMQQLVRDLLDYSRASSEELRVEAVDAGQVVAELVEEMSDGIAAAGARVDVGPLPVVMADRVQLRQVFQNLISNALKFRGEEAAHIAISADGATPMATFSVQDNGIGMDTKHADRVFQMFQRLHERSRYEGSGIGLAVVKTIVHRHGGRVWYESTIGAGTTMKFTWSCAGSA